MYRLLGHLDGEAFARRVGWALVALVAATVAWSFLLGPLVLGMGCARAGGGGCGALALLLSLIVKPVLFGAFIAYATYWAIPRLRQAGQTPAFVLAISVPIVLLPSLTFWTVASAPWSVGFALGYLGGGIPLEFNVALACLLGLALIPAADIDEDGARIAQPISPLLWCLIALAGATIVGYVLQRAMLSAVVDGRVTRPVRVGMSFVTVPILYAKHCLVLAVAWFGYKACATGGNRMTSPTLSLGLLASLVAVVQIVISLGFWIGYPIFGVKSSIWLVQLVSYLQLGQFLCLVALFFLIGSVSTAAPAKPERPGNPTTPRPAIAARPASFGRRGTAT